MSWTGLGRWAGGVALATTMALAFGDARAQQQGHDPANAPQFSAQDADDAFAQLRNEVPGLRANWNFETGFPEFIYGRAIDLLDAPTDDAGYEAAARRFVDLFPGLFGYDSSVLLTEQVKRIPLAMIGTTDKVGVGFSQWVDGLQVVGGSLSFLFDASGRIVGIENRGLPNLRGIDAIPTLTEREATILAMNAYRNSPAHVLEVAIAIVPDATGTHGVLAWLVEIGGAFDVVHQLPIQERFAIDAHTGALIRRETTIHSFTDIKGETRQWATPGTLPDKSGNPIQKFLLMRGDVKSSVGNTVTDLKGLWTIAYSGTTQQTITWTFSSTSVYAYVDDRGNADYSKSKLVTPGTKDFTGLNQNGTQYNTAEMNAQRHGVTFREWVVGLDSTDTKMDFRQRLNVNINSSCNAYYDGSSTNYYRAAGGCVNTAYSTVVGHEVGHWANDKYGSGNGWDGFGEGAADTWAMYIYDTPIVGEDFFNGGGDIRDGRNSRQYCGRCNSGCYGEVHADGEVLMGALWKVRDHLNTTLGDAPGDDVADHLLLAWFQGYNATTICDTNLSQILTLDDDNGNIDDGTPHSGDINQGFVDQGYPSYY